MFKSRFELIYLDWLSMFSDVFFVINYAKHQTKHGKYHREELQVSLGFEQAVVIFLSLEHFGVSIPTVLVLLISWLSETEKRRLSWSGEQPQL